MKWDMEIEEIEAVLEKIWDLHDKLSDAIHSISRTHFLNSIKTLKNSEKKHDHHHQQQQKQSLNGGADETRTGFVFVKDYRVDEDDDVSAITEAKSLNAIRTALENLEDQLEFFHTVQVQQRAERDAAVARLEQSRIILAMRLAEHHGKKYKVIEEAFAFVGDVRDAGRYVSPENLYRPTNSSVENFVTLGGNRQCCFDCCWNACLVACTANGPQGQICRASITMGRLCLCQQKCEKNFSAGGGVI
ncbi:plastid division protein PDV1 isoform X2 [Malania oleifera]|uniref:plastid division protein PDV1 isoform X2 n=1 Tax=Malania oleifera TaxID=397392 RepID=UPI0025AE49E8|nr:plastid division protein PDV1 isoform X2 [Malania oleifera]